MVRREGQEVTEIKSRVIQAKLEELILQAVVETEGPLVHREEIREVEIMMMVPMVHLAVEAVGQEETELVAQVEKVWW